MDFKLFIVFFAFSISNSCTTQGLNSREEAAGRSLLFLHSLLSFNKLAFSSSFCAFHMCVESTPTKHGCHLSTATFTNRGKLSLGLLHVSYFISCLFFSSPEKFFNIILPFLEASSYKTV